MPNDTNSNSHNNSLNKHEIENGPEQGGATPFEVEESDQIIQETHIFLLS